MWVEKGVPDNDNNLGGLDSWPWFLCPCEVTSPDGDTGAGASIAADSGVGVGANVASGAGADIAADAGASAGAKVAADAGANIIAGGGDVLSTPWNSYSWVQHLSLAWCSAPLMYLIWSTFWPS